MAEKRLEMKIGSKVITTDGEIGRLLRIVLHPDEGNVVALILRENFIAEHALLLPIKYVVDSTEDAVLLNISRAQLSDLQGVNPAQYTELARDRDGYVIDRSTASNGGDVGSARVESRPVYMLHASQKVFAMDGPAGYVEMLLLDPQGQVRDFVLKRDNLWGRKLIVPSSWVLSVDRRGVHLAVQSNDLEALPEYSHDREIADKVEDALWSDDVLRESVYDRIVINVADGVVTLTGHISGTIVKNRAVRMINNIDGVLKVENYLVADDELEITVAGALANDPRTRDQMIYVSVDHGVVYLSGQVEDEDVPSIARERAASVPEVRGVVESIQSPGVEDKQENGRILQPPIGGLVFATDMQVGGVKQVVINPHNRQVTGFIVKGYFPDSERVKTKMPVYMMPMRERRVVVPICAVRHVNGSDILLAERALEISCYPDFDPANFDNPGDGWKPPYPYHPDEVLLESYHAAYQVS